MPFAAVLRHGLPSEADASWLAATAGWRRLLFLGDADPADLLIYAWLRERACLQKNLAIEYCGLSDTLLQKCGVPFENRLTIEMKPSELAAMPLIAEHLGDLTALLGPWCAGLLAAGHKIELEAPFSFATCGPAQNFPPPSWDKSEFAYERCIIRPAAELCIERSATWEP